MADGQTGATRPWLWTELFRTFQVAIVPKSLFLAAMGVLIASTAMTMLSWGFFKLRSEPKPGDYAAEYYMKHGYGEEAARRKAIDDFATAQTQYKFFNDLAGERGAFRLMPWHEDRGANPLLLVTGNTIHGSGFAGIWEWIKHDGIRVMIEPLRKFLLPVKLLLNPQADFISRIYLLLIAFVTLATWAFFGGAITRMAVMHFAGKDPPGISEALRFVAQKYAHYIAAPFVPLLLVAGIALITVLTFGLLHHVNYLGDLANAIIWPIAMLLGFAQALLLVGLVGYPLMFATISAEGTDAFDALSRSYNYVYQGIWNYIWYGIIAIAYGMVLVLFVGFMGTTAIYLSKWAISQTPFTEAREDRRADHLFVYAPTTFGWRDALVDRPELKSTATPEVRDAYMDRVLGKGNYISARGVQLWTNLALLVVIGFGYSYFFVASTMIYLLMRHKIDDTELDEVYSEDELGDEPLMPRTTLPRPGAAAEPQVQMVDAPTLRTPEKS